MLDAHAISPSNDRRIAAAIVAAVTLAFAIAGASSCGKGDEQPTQPSSPVATKPHEPLASKPDKNMVAVLETTAGTIVIAFYSDEAPGHTVAFQNMFRLGFFDGTTFFRVIPKHIIQGGDPNTKDDNPYDDGLGQESQRRLAAEFSPRLRQVRGTVSAAHQTGDNDSATSQFFIVTGPERQLDGKYTIFGHVVEGMEVVDAIAAAPLRTDDLRLRERPVDPVRITRGYLRPRKATE